MDRDDSRQADKDAVRRAAATAKHDPQSERNSLDAHQQAAIDDKRTDTELKKLYAYRFIWILIGQLLAMNLIFVAIGFGFLKYSDFVINLFMGGTLAEVFGIVLVITKYLFSRKEA